MSRQDEPQLLQGPMHGQGLRIAVVAGRFNELIVQRLYDGAIQTLKRYGVAAQDIQVVWVPGAFEIPLVAQRLAQSQSVDAVIALGAVIRGATPHFDHVAGQCSAGLQHAALKTSVPMVFGVLTCDTLEQAFERAGCKAGNKGSDAALTAIEMAQLFHCLPKKES